MLDKTNTFLALGLALSLGLGACQTQLEVTAPSAADPVVAPVLAREKVYLHYQPPTRSAGFGTQAVDLSQLKFLRATLVGGQISGSIQSELVPVSGGTAPLTLADIPRENGELRVITVQGYDADQVPLSAFVAGGFYRSSSQQGELDLLVNRRQLLSALALKALLQQQPGQTLTLDLEALQATVDQATGFEAQSRSFVSDPLLFRPQILANLMQTGQIPTATEVITQARVTPPQPSLNLDTLRGGDFAEAVVFSINDPLSESLTIPAGSQSPIQISSLQIPPGTWQARVSKSDGTLLDTATVTVNGQGEISLSKSHLAAPVTETPVLTAISITQGILGASVTLTGRGFDLTLENNLVRFGDTAATVTAATPTSLTLTVPEVNAGLYPVSLSLAGQNSVSTPEFEIQPSIQTVAGDGTQGYSGDGGPASAAHLNTPTSVAFDSEGNLYIADRNNSRIRKVDTNGVITTVAGTGSEGYSGDGGLATEAQLNRPYGITVHRDELYIADWHNHRVRKVDSHGIITTVAGNGTEGYSGDGDLATAAQLNRPNGVALDSADNLYFTDSQNHRVRKVDTDGIITTFAGNGIATFSGNGVLATAASLNGPTDLAFDSQDQLYIVDRQNHRIRRVDNNGIITTIAGTGSANHAGNNGPATSAGLSFPIGIFIDPQNQIFIGDNTNSRLRRINTEGIISTLAGDGSYGYNGDGILATSARLNALFDVAVNAQGQIYVADTHNHRIRRIR